MMEMRARNQYLKVLQERYLRAPKKEKGRILDENCKNTGQNRPYRIPWERYVIRKIRSQIMLEEKPGRKRGWVYDGHVIAALVQIWEIFDYPCGQRLSPLLKTMVERLREIKELRIPEEVANKLLLPQGSLTENQLSHD
jgi:hypothetical protein